ncbi:5163_t:CDS:2, partial [Entrophospora sp. SA101]
EKGKEKSELDGHGLKLMAEINSQEKTETDDQDEPLERALKSRKLKAEQARIDKNSSTVQYYEHDEAIDIWSFGIVNYMLSKKNIHGILMVM